MHLTKLASKYPYTRIHVTIAEILLATTCDLQNNRNCKQKRSATPFMPHTLQHFAVFFNSRQGNRCLSHRHLRIEINPVFEMLCSLQYRTTDKLQNPSSPVLTRPVNTYYKFKAILKQLLLMFAFWRWLIWSETCSGSKTNSLMYVTLDFDIMRIVVHNSERGRHNAHSNQDLINS
jgi:hypothetical protein